MQYLLKTEPDGYSISDLKRDGETLWDEVTNPAAVKHLREMQPKDRLIVYHTGNERSAVGLASVVSVDAGNPKQPLVRVRYRSRIEPRTLAEIKQEKLFRDSPLVRQGRLSVVPLTDEQYQWFIRKK